MTPPEKGDPGSRAARQALMDMARRLGAGLHVDAVSLCVLDDSQENLLVLPMSGDPAHQGELRKILPVGCHRLPAASRRRSSTAAR
ncbi:MAG: hypothetical protein ACE5IK_13555, partial [Acidobacteriota bacterium]